MRPATPVRLSIALLLANAACARCQAQQQTLHTALQAWQPLDQVRFSTVVVTSVRSPTSSTTSNIFLDWAIDGPRVELRTRIERKDVDPASSGTHYVTEPGTVAWFIAGRVMFSQASDTVDQNRRQMLANDSFGGQINGYLLLPGGEPVTLHELLSHSDAHIDHTDGRLTTSVTLHNAKVTTHIDEATAQVTRIEIHQIDPDEVFQSRQVTIDSIEYSRHGDLTLPVRMAVNGTVTRRPWDDAGESPPITEHFTTTITRTVTEHPYRDNRPADALLHLIPDGTPAISLDEPDSPIQKVWYQGAPIPALDALALESVRESARAARDLTNRGTNSPRTNPTAVPWLPILTIASIAACIAAFVAWRRTTVMQGKSRCYFVSELPSS